MSQVITPSVSTRIKLKIKQKIEALDSVDKVYGYQHVNPDGWPAVMVMPADMDGEFSSNAENKRLYSFDVLAAFPMNPEGDIPEGAVKEEYAEQVIATVIDEIINSMDTDFELDDSDPTVLYVEAADCSWGTFNAESGVAKAAQINLRVYTELTVNP